MAKSRKRTNFGVLFWIASILLLSVLYLANHRNIQRVLDTTRFMEVVFEENQPVEPDGASEPGEAVSAPAPVAEEPRVATETPQPEESPEAESESTVAEEPSQSDQPEPPVQSTAVTLYFIRVSDDGRIIPEAVERSVPAGDSPLTRTIESLVNGPNVDAINRGLLNLVPEGTRLLSASVEGRVAYLNFSEEFRFNPLGTEGSLAQLQQVVYSATAFSSIDRVQILVEGNVLDYLSVEGIYIGAPLSRDTFRA